MKIMVSAKSIEIRSHKQVKFYSVRQESVINFWFPLQLLSF